MPLYSSADRHYNNGALYTNVMEWSGAIATNASGNAVYYLTDDGTAGGNALFTAIFPESITVTTLSSSVILLTGTPVISTDKKTITIPVRQNTSLLGLGLIPFGAAVAGSSVYMTCKGVYV